MRYNNEPQFFIADADVLLSVAADMLERLGDHLEPEMIDAELVTRLREGVDLVERRRRRRARRVRRMPAKRVFLAATGQNRGKTTTSIGLLAAIRARGLRLGFLKPVGQRYLVVDGTRADEDAVLMSEAFGLPDVGHVAGDPAAPLHDRLCDGPRRRRSRGAGPRRPDAADKDVVASRAPGTRESARSSGSRTRVSLRCSTPRSSS